MPLRVVLASRNRGRAFDPDIVAGIGASCAWGMPQVLLCRPWARGGIFPTSLWLDCPFLEKKVGRLESGGLGRVLAAILSSCKEEYARYSIAHSRLRLGLLRPGEAVFLRGRRPGLFDALRKGGVGGTPTDFDHPTVKCLHLQVAALLALPGHPAAEFLREHLGATDCDEGLCRTLLPER